ARIVAAFETHVQADHVSGLPALVERTGATAYLPEGAGVDFEHVALGDDEAVELGNTLVTAIATPGHAPAHNAYAVADRRRGDEEPWLVVSGDSLLIGDVGRPDLHVGGDARRPALVLPACLTAVVGALVGLERSVLPLVGKEDFGLRSSSAILAFVVAFGAAKALTNLAAGDLAERIGRKRLLVIGWLVALPVPLLIGLAPS